MELFLTFNLDRWGAVDVFDLGFDFRALKMQPLGEDEDRFEERVELQGVAEENRLVLLWGKQEGEAGSRPQELLPKLRSLREEAV